MGGGLIGEINFYALQMSYVHMVDQVVSHDMDVLFIMCVACALQCLLYDPQKNKD